MRKKLPKLERGNSYYYILKVCQHCFEKQKASDKKFIIRRTVTDIRFFDRCLECSLYKYKNKEEMESVPTMEEIQGDMREFCYDCKNNNVMDTLMCRVFRCGFNKYQKVIFKKEVRKIVDGWKP